MAQEWSLPGGWNDYDQTTAQNCVKEAKEESGRIVKPVKLIAVQDRNHHNKPILTYSRSFSKNSDLNSFY